jgi:hypothetical protein
MIKVSALKRLDPAAWTQLLTREPANEGLVVTDVRAEPVGRGEGLTRYVLTLAGSPEPISLIGKATNGVEAQFYRRVAPHLGRLVPHCWLSRVDGERGWLIVDESPQDHPPSQWIAEDVERIINLMAELHARYWQDEELLSGLGWRPLLNGVGSQPPVAAQAYSGQQKRRPPGAQPISAEPRNSDPEAPAAMLSYHAQRSFGTLAPTMELAASGLDRLRDLGGWPGVLDESHLEAVADLLDDPVPMLLPLRQLPVTLIHGSVAARKWRVSLFDDYRLVDWRWAAIGPGIYDLVSFIEQYEPIALQSDGWNAAVRWPLSEETMEDSYILALSSQLGASFPAAAVRQAIPAARCLFVLTTWMPRLAEWLPDTLSLEVWRAMNQLTDEELEKADLTRLVGLRPHLAHIFRRFLQASRLL